MSYGLLASLMAILLAFSCGAFLNKLVITDKMEEKYAEPNFVVCGELLEEWAYGVCNGDIDIECPEEEE